MLDDVNESERALIKRYDEVFIVDARSRPALTLMNELSQKAFKVCIGVISPLTPQLIAAPIKLLEEAIVYRIADDDCCRGNVNSTNGRRRTTPQRGIASSG